ncbi:MAG TPA: hypothetical protein VFM27_00330 [Acidimicrobiales bacterium]|nr:hypothetical protein [Acidimicrobiales bacterium]
MGEDATAEHRRNRILVAAGITPGAELSEPARAALATLEAQPALVVDAILAMLVLLIEGRRPPDSPPASSGRLVYPNPAARPRATLPRGEPGNSGP